jgi:putative restriction endonuclease
MQWAQQRNEAWGSFMFGTIAPTDLGWYEALRGRGYDEVNFWKPSGRKAFRADQYSPFLFKLKAPHNAICGFGVFVTWTPLPDWLAWESFGERNGAASFEDMQARITRIRRAMRYDPEGGPDMIGCLLLAEPVFLEPEAFIPQPRDWPVRSLTPVRYDLTKGEGLRVWQACQERAAARLATAQVGVAMAREESPRYGAEVMVRPRLGQGSFRILVTDAYQRCCAVTGEHSLPVLEAAHIKPYAQGGPHDVRNGLLLRSDVHRLFDQGYVTVDDTWQLVVSERLRREYRNGRTYYPFHGQRLAQPFDASARPAIEFLHWHQEHRFRA